MPRSSSKSRWLLFIAAAIALVVAVGAAIKINHAAIENHDAWKENALVDYTTVLIIPGFLADLIIGQGYTEARPAIFRFRDDVIVALSSWIVWLVPIYLILHPHIKPNGNR